MSFSLARSILQPLPSERRKLAHDRKWIFPPIPTLETLRGVPDATKETAKKIVTAGWLAALVFGISSLFVIVSLVAVLGRVKSENWNVVTFAILCWVVVGVPYLIGGVAWLVQWLMKGVFEIAYGLLSLLILGVGFGSLLAVVLEVKHLQPHLRSKA